MGDDDDRAMILTRRAQWIAMALSVVGAQGCHEPDEELVTATATAAPKETAPLTATAAPQETARPTACLSFSCPQGSVHVRSDGTRGGSPMTARPEAGDCVPRGSLKDPDAPARVEPPTSAKPTTR